VSFPSKKTRVLVVEDEPDIAALMKHALERGTDLQVEIVGTGAAALSAVTEDPPSLVLLDLNLPFIDGLPAAAKPRGERGHSDHHGHRADE
jgi:CheY-like chemotaxis protein